MEVVENSELKVPQNMVLNLFDTVTIKFALLLQKVSADPLNILLLGTPGIGKTTLLKTAVRLYDKAYCINSPHLTSSALKILLKSDYDMLAFDEFGYSNSRVKNLLRDSLIYRNFSIIEGKQWVSYPMRTSIIVADTPIGGTFDPYIPFEMQIRSKIDTWLFDFVFLVTNNFLEENKIMSENINLKLFNMSFNELTNRIKIAKNIQIKRFDPFAKDSIKDFYVKCRQICEYREISLRNFSAMVNIAESIAKLDFMTEVRKDHVSLMKKFYIGNLLHRRLVFNEPYIEETLEV